MPKNTKPVVEEEGVALDFSGVKPFEPLDERPNYLVMITKLSEIHKAKGSDTKVSDAEFTILGPDEVVAADWKVDDDGKAQLTGGFKADEDGSPVMTKSKGRKLFRTYPIQDNALPFLHELIKAADPKADLSGKFNYVPSKYVGITVAVKIKNEGFNEQIRARVQRVMPKSAYTE